MVNPIARFRAWRREQRAKERIIIDVYMTGMDLERTMVKLALVGRDHDAVFVRGQKYTCLHCRRTFKQDHRSSWGFCQRCSR